MMERTYVIPLRREFQKVPVYKRAPKAVRAVRSFIQKHMKSDDVRVGKYLNLKLWERGNRNPPHKVHVKALDVEEKDEKFVRVELVGAPEEKPKEEPKKGVAEKLRERVIGKESKKETTEEKKEESKEEKQKADEKKEAPVREEKEKIEVKTLKKEKLKKEFSEKEKK